MFVELGQGEITGGGSAQFGAGERRRAFYAHPSGQAVRIDTQNPRRHGNTGNEAWNRVSSGQWGLCWDVIGQSINWPKWAWHRKDVAEGKIPGRLPRCVTLPKRRILGSGDIMKVFEGARDFQHSVFAEEFAIEQQQRKERTKKTLTVVAPIVGAAVLGLILFRRK